MATKRIPRNKLALYFTVGRRIPDPFGGPEPVEVLGFFDDGRIWSASFRGTDGLVHTTQQHPEVLDASR